MWYAVMNGSNEVIAEDQGHADCSVKALATGRWVDFNDPAGSVAPYRLQTFKPAESISVDAIAAQYDVVNRQLFGRIERVK